QLRFTTPRLAVEFDGNLLRRELPVQVIQQPFQLRHLVEVATQHFTQLFQERICVSAITLSSPTATMVNSHRQGGQVNQDLEHQFDNVTNGHVTVHIVRVEVTAASRIALADVMDLVNVFHLQEGDAGHIHSMVAFDCAQTASHQRNVTAANATVTSPSASEVLRKATPKVGSGRSSLTFVGVHAANFSFAQF